MVAHHAAQKARLGGAYAVVVVQIERGQGADVDFELQVAGDVARQFVVQAVNALYDDRLIRVHVDGVGFVAAPAVGEVEQRRVHRFALQKTHQMIVEQRHVQRVQALEIALAVLVHGNEVAVEIVVVQRNGDRAQPQHAQGDVEPVGERRLAR